ncbi:MAG: hypothetical protein WD597_06765, partial [Balneolaceae bacterium]
MKLIAALIMLIYFPFTAIAQFNSLIQIDSIRISEADRLSSLSTDGQYIYLTVLYEDELYLKSIDQDLNELTALNKIISSDEVNGLITFQTHVLLNENIFTVFSTANNSLHIVRANTSGEKIGATVDIPISNSDSLQNIMFNTDEQNLYLVYQTVESKTEVHVFDDTLALVQEPFETAEHPHQNYGGIFFNKELNEENNAFYYFSGDSSGLGSNLISTKWASDFTGLENTFLLKESEENEGYFHSTGVEFFEGYWLLGYQFDFIEEQQQVNTINISVFQIYPEDDSSEEVFKLENAADTMSFNPHFTLLANYLYMSYENQDGIFLKKFELRFGLSNEKDEIPQKTVLHQNYPNPFNPKTNITFDLEKPGFVTLKVYNLLGQEVITLASDIFPNG